MPNVTHTRRGVDVDNTRAPHIEVKCECELSSRGRHCRSIGSDRRQTGGASYQQLKLTTSSSSVALADVSTVSGEGGGQEGGRIEGTSINKWARIGPERSTLQENHPHHTPHTLGFNCIPSHSDTSSSCMSDMRSAVGCLRHGTGR
jgi:hypothetical protein